MAIKTNGFQIPETDILKLTFNIVRHAASISAYLEDNHLSNPTFEPGSPEPPETEAYLSHRSQLVSSLEDLHRLVDGPRRTMRTFACNGNDLAALQVAFDFDFFHIVPLNGEIEIGELAKIAGLDVDRAGRILRMLVTHRIFAEKRPGYFTHSANSSIFATDEDLRCAGHYMVDEMWKAATATSECIKAAPYDSDNDHSPFKTRLGLPMFAYYAQNPQYATRFAKAMKGATRVDRQISELRYDFPWDELQDTVVDVGGGSGHVSMSLAQDFPHLNFIVQDSSLDMIAEGKRIVGHLADRVSFMQHNFFDPQPLRDVGAFFIRQCTHNWCDRDVITIFRSFVPGLEGSKPGTPLLINDTIMPELGAIPLHEERGLRQMDLLMMVGLGAKQRTQTEFESLLKQADNRYEIRKVHADGSMGLLEVHLRH